MVFFGLFKFQRTTYVLLQEAWKSGTSHPWLWPLDLCWQKGEWDVGCMPRRKSLKVKAEEWSANSQAVPLFFLVSLFFLHCVCGMQIELRDIPARDPLPKRCTVSSSWRHFSHPQVTLWRLALVQLSAAPFSRPSLGPYHPSIFTALIDNGRRLRWNLETSNLTRH